MLNNPNKVFIITLLFSLALHFFALSVMFKIPDINTEDEYTQVSVRLGIKGGNSNKDKSGIEKLASYAPSAGASRQAANGNSDRTPPPSPGNESTTKPADAVPEKTIEVSKEVSTKEIEVKSTNLIPIQNAKETAANEKTAPPIQPQLELKKIIEPTSTAPIATTDSALTQELFSEDEEEEGVVIGNSSGQNSNRLATYEQMLPLWLNKFRKYPEEAKRDNITGTGEVFIKIDRNGKVLLSRIIQSTGSQILDRSLLNMLYEADPVLPVPTSYYPDKKTFSYKIEFEFKD